MTQRDMKYKHGLFTVTSNIYKDASHDINNEQQEIFYAKLRTKLSPPFKDISLEDILPGKVDDNNWMFHLQNSGITIAIKEKAFEFYSKAFNSSFISDLRKNEKNLFKECNAICSSICKYTQSRISAETNLISEVRRWEELKLRRKIFLESKGEQFDNDINVMPVGSGNLPQPSSMPVQQTSFPSTTINRADINALQHLAMKKYCQYEYALQQLNDFENALSHKRDKITYKLQVGQKIPDNVEEILECRLCRLSQEGCQQCPGFVVCSMLIDAPDILNVYNAYTAHKTDLSKKIRCAWEDFEIDFYTPMENTAEESFHSFPLDFIECAIDRIGELRVI